MRASLTGWHYRIRAATMSVQSGRPWANQGEAMQVSGFWWLAGALLVLGGAVVFYYNRLVFNRHRVAEASPS